MPLTIVDSDILVNFTRGDETAADWLDAAEADSTLVISSITEMELMVGSRSKAHLREIQKFLSRFQIVSINEQISTQASELIEQYCLSHGLLIPDALIAATALTLDKNLASINQRDFRFIDGLKLLNYP
jgi:predicted nucleic acid-binding protein